MVAIEAVWDLAEVADSVLGGTLAAQDFTRVTGRRTHAAYVLPNSGMLALEYSPEVVPRQIICIVGTFDVLEGSGRSVGLGYIHPEVDRAAVQRGLQFDSESTLVDALDFFRQSILQEFVMPTLADISRLVEFLDLHEGSLAANEQLRLDEELLRRARQAFQDGDYQSAITRYVIYGPGRLPAVDKQRLKIARRPAGA
jgi:hypothetical protein